MMKPIVKQHQIVIVGIEFLGHHGMWIYRTPNDTLMHVNGTVNGKTRFVSVETSEYFLVNHGASFNHLSRSIYFKSCNLRIQ